MEWRANAGTSRWCSCEAKVDRGSRGHWYWVVRGEILGPTQDQHVRKHLAKDAFIDQERRSGDRRRSDTVVVLTVNYADWGSEAQINDALGTLREIKVFGFWGKYGRKAET